MSHLPHLQTTNHDHEPSTYVGSVGSLTSPSSDLGLHPLGMEEDLDEKNIAASMFTYHEQNDRIWRWYAAFSLLVCLILTRDIL